MHQRGCLTHVNHNTYCVFNRRRGDWPSSHSPYIYTLVLGEQEMKLQDYSDVMKRWGIAFVIGATVGLVIGQNRVFDMIEKDCQVLSMFRINETAYACKFTTTK